MKMYLSCLVPSSHIFTGKFNMGGGGGMGDIHREGKQYVSLEADWYVFRPGEEHPSEISLKG